jgi:fatty acid desaturase
VYTYDLMTGSVAPTDSGSTRKLSEFFTKDEITALSERSDLRGAVAIAGNWALVAGAFVLLAQAPGPLTFVVALCVIAGRQLGLAILQHEGSHRTLFRTKWLNDVLTDFLCARPVWQHLGKYRAHHLRHHGKAGTDQDPDISLHAGFPISRASMRRKLVRDLVGITGLKTLVAFVLMDAEVIRWTVSTDIEWLPRKGRTWYSYPLAFFRNASGMLATNAVLFGILVACGHAALYGVWVLAFFTPYPLFVRVRSIAEHGCVTRSPDVLENTRTTRAGLLLRLTVAPNRVNYHIEHHLLAGVPFYRLPKMHRMLREKGLLEAPPSYWDVLRLASSG